MSTKISSLPQDTWEGLETISRAYRHYQTHLPEFALNRRFFLKFKKARTDLIQTYKRLNTWDKVAQEETYKPIPAGTLSTFANDFYLPLKWFEHFGLPTFAQAPTCISCGKVHTTKRCTEKKRKYKSLFDMPTKVLKFKLENREKYEI